MTFKVGDRVKRISGKCAGMYIGDVSIVLSVGSTCVELSGYSGQHLISNLSLVCRSSCSNTMDKETLKAFNKDNLAEGKRQAEEDKANYEATEAKRAYVSMVDRKETQERIVKVAEEELKEIKEELKLFK